MKPTTKEERERSGGAVTAVCEHQFWAFVRKNQGLVARLLNATRQCVHDSNPMPLHQLWLSVVDEAENIDCVALPFRREYVAPMSRLIFWLDPSTFGVFERRDSECDDWDWPSVTEDVTEEVREWLGAKGVGYGQKA